MEANRDWTVLFVGGASGIGKSSLAYELGRFYGVNVLEVDDVHLTVQTVTTKESFPTIHYFAANKDVKSEDLGVQGNLNWLVDVSKELIPVLKELVNRHIEDQLPVIIEGDFIYPELIKSLNHPQVKAIFINEPDANQIMQNYLAREGGDLQQFRAEVSVAYGQWIAEICNKLNINVIESRPWNTTLSRAINSIK